MEDKINGVAKQLMDTATATAAQISGVASTATHAAGATEAGMGAVAQVTETSQNMITTTSTPTKGTTRIAKAAGLLISLEENPMELSTPKLTSKVVITQQPSMLKRATKRLASEKQASLAEMAMTASA